MPYLVKSVPQIKLGWKNQPNFNLLSNVVSLTGLEWNTLYESLIKLDKQLDDIGLEVVND